MARRDLYEGAHLFVAGIRIHEHLHGRPPALGDLARILKVSEEELSLMARKLCDEMIVTEVISGAECRYGVGDHTRIETLPRHEQAPRMADEITQFQSRQQSRLKEIEQSLGDSKDKKRVFSDLEKALKDPSSQQKKKNPLD
jgi:DNA-binding transcriptional regulator GbsR (MarR family)